MKKIWIIFLAVLLLSLAGCGAKDEAGTPNMNGSDAVAMEQSQSEEGKFQSEDVPIEPESADDETAPSTEEEKENIEMTFEESPESEEETMKLQINDTEVSVAWEENDSVDALMELAKEAPIVIDMSMYGGFEQVGSIGQSIPRNDEQTTTKAGDIVLYSGNQVVVFYGSNSWAYTRLGRITDKTEQELAEMLGNGDVVLRFEVK